MTACSSCDLCSGPRKVFDYTWVNGFTLTGCTPRCYQREAHKITSSARPVKDLPSRTRTIKHFNRTEEITIPFKSDQPTLIRKGNLFLTVCRTGEDSWSHAVRSLRQHDSFERNKRVVVLSGIHGTEMGFEVHPPSDLSGQRYWTHHHPPESKGIIDSSHLRDDVEVVKGLGIVGHNMSVEKAYNQEYKATTNDLKAKTANLLKDGNLVIWGWCHSLFSCREFTRQYPEPTPFSREACALQVKQDVAWGVPIAYILQTDFGWVP